MMIPMKHSVNIHFNFLCSEKKYTNFNIEHTRSVLLHVEQFSLFFLINCNFPDRQMVQMKVTKFKRTIISYGYCAYLSILSTHVKFRFNEGGTICLSKTKGYSIQTNRISNC